MNSAFTTNPHSGKTDGHRQSQTRGRWRIYTINHLDTRRWHGMLPHAIHEEFDEGVLEEDDSDRRGAFRGCGKYDKPAFISTPQQSTPSRIRCWEERPRDTTWG